MHGKGGGCKTPIPAAFQTRRAHSQRKDEKCPKGATHFCIAPFGRDLAYKPGSVIDSHLSWRTVADTLQPPKRRQPGQPCLHCGVAPDRVYRAARFHTAAGELLPRLSTLTTDAPVHYQASVEAHKG